MANVIYWGLFLDDDSVDLLDDIFGGDGLAELIDDPHVTFEFRPADIDTSLLGTSLTCRVTGYGNDGQNQGVSVELEELPHLCKNPVPHVTLSLAHGAQAKDTGGLAFAPVEEDILLSGTIGAFFSNGRFDFGD